MIVDPVTATLAVVIGAIVTHKKSANLLNLGKSHTPTPTACITTKSIIHSHE